MTNPNEVWLREVALMPDAELEALAEALYGLISDASIAQALVARGRAGTVSRYSSLTTAKQSVDRLRNPELNGGVHAYAVILGESVVGMATCQPNLKLHLPRPGIAGAILPARLLRRLRFERTLAPPGENVAAWTTRETTLSYAYERILDTSSGQAWTLEPHTSRSYPGIGIALQNAGFSLASGLPQPGRYDDYETPGYLQLFDLYCGSYRTVE